MHLCLIDRRLKTSTCRSVGSCGWGSSPCCHQRWCAWPSFGSRRRSSDDAATTGACPLLAATQSGPVCEDIARRRSLCVSSMAGVGCQRKPSESLATRMQHDLWIGRSSRGLAADASQRTRLGKAATRHDTELAADWPSARNSQADVWQVRNASHFAWRQTSSVGCPNSKVGRC